VRISNLASLCGSIIWIQSRLFKDNQ